MTETGTAADEQDLAKALDDVASAAGGTTPLSHSSPDDTLGSSPVLPPIVPPGSPVAPTTLQPSEPSFPSIKQVHDSNDSLYQSSKGDDTVSVSNDDTTAAQNPAGDTESGPLADIKKDALQELRPLVDKLNVSPEEKFDTYLLLIRSTDDQELIAPAHEAAKAIADETRRAEALLDIVKEIDYLTHQKKS